MTQYYISSLLQRQSDIEHNEKYKLQVEHLKLLNEKVKVQTYKLQLEALKLEKELGVPPSQITANFHDVQIATYEIVEGGNTVITNENENVTYIPINL